MSQVNKKIPVSDLKKSEQIVVRTGKNNFIDKLIFPNPVVIGLDDSNLRSLLTTEGGIKINPAIPADTAGTLYNSNGTLFFNGEPLLTGSNNSTLFSDVPLICAGEGICFVTGSSGEITISALAQDTGIRAVSVGTAIGNVPDTLHNKTLLLTDAEGRNVTFTYDKQISCTSPARTSATSYKIGCADAITDVIHATGVRLAVNLARTNGDLNILTSISDQIITLTQGKGGETGNVPVSGTAVALSLITFTNSNSFIGGSASLPSVNAQYLTLAATGDLNNERVMTAGLGLSAIDGGPNAAYTLSIDESIVPRKNSSNSFSGTQTFTGEIRGTHRKLADGSSAFIAGKNVRITNNINGSVTIESIDTDTTYTPGNGLKLSGNQFSLKLDAAGALSFAGGSLTLNSSNLAGAYLSNDSTGKLRVNIAPGRGLVGTSNNIAVNTDDIVGAGLISSGQKIMVDDSKVATLTGSNFTGTVKFLGDVRGSITKLVSGDSFIAAGDNIRVISQSNGQILITSSYVNTTYLPGPGLELSATTFGVALKDHGGLAFDDAEVILDTQTVIGEGLAEGTTGLLAVDRGQVAFLTGTKFTGQVNFDAGLRGSLTKLTDGSSFIIAGNNITVATGSNGSVEISSTASGTATPAGSTGDIQVNVSGSLAAFAPLHYDDASSSLHVPKIVGSQLTGSLTTLFDGSPFIVSGPNITITTASNGQVLISGAPTTFVASRRRFAYIVTGTHPAHAPLFLPDVDFSLAEFAANLIDVTCNGALLYSGSSLERSSSIVDYSLNGSNSIAFAFDLVPDDVIQTAMLTSGSDSATVVPGGSSGVNGSIQYNDAGNFSGDTDFTYSSLTKTLTVPSISGSLTRLVSGDPYIVTSGSILDITTGSNGSIIISDTFDSVPAVVYDPSYATSSSKCIIAQGPITVVTASSNLKIGLRREKIIHEMSAFHSAHSELVIPGAQFSVAGFDDKRIDIYVNGQLLTSGSSRDYELSGTEDGIRLSFDLLEKDIIVAVIQ